MGLVNALRQYLNNEELSDVRFLVGSAARKCFFGHRFILAARSPVFRSMLYGNFKEASSAEPLVVDDIEPAAFQAMLEYIYADEVHVDAGLALEVLFCAKKYLLPALSESCVVVLETSIRSDSVCTLLSHALALDEKDLVSHCMGYLREHADEILTRDETPAQLSEEALGLIVQDDSMGIEEVSLFRLCLAWADKHPDGSATRYAQILPLMAHIRFPLMTQKQIAAHVVPAEVLRADELVDIFTHLAMNGSTDCRFSAKPRMARRWPEHTLYRSGREHPHAVGSWSYTGAIDAVTVIVDRPVWLHALGVFGGSGTGLNGKVFVRRGPSVQSGVLLADQLFCAVSSRESVLTTISFAAPLALEPHIEYTLVQHVDRTAETSRQFQGARDASSDISSHGVRFLFFDSVNTSNNGTSPFGGQIPALYWSHRR